MLNSLRDVLIGVLALVAGAFGIYLKGRAEGRDDERAARERDVNEQAAEARREVQDVEAEIDASDDAAVRDVARKWLRK